MSNVVKLDAYEADKAAEIAADAIARTGGLSRGVRFEVIAIMLANEVFDIAGITKSGGSMADAEKLTDDMMLWLTERAMELHGEVAMKNVERTTAQ